MNEWTEFWGLSEPACGQSLVQSLGSSNWQFQCPLLRGSSSWHGLEAQHKPLVRAQLPVHFTSTLEDNQGCNQLKGQGECSVPIYFCCYVSF